MPAYIAFYTIVPRAIGGRLYSDTMGRVAFVLFLVFSMPIGIHHLFADPQVGAGFKFVHAAMTAMVSVPTLLTVFTIVASVEIAGRLRGGNGTLRLGQGPAVGQPDDAGGDVLVRHARLRRRRRHHQHELPAQRDDPQHAVGDRTLPPHLRRRHRHHVLHGRLRAVAAADAMRTAVRRARSRRSSGSGSSACWCSRCRGTWSACSACRGAWRTTTIAIRRSQPQAWTVTVSTFGGLHAGRLGAPVRLHPRPRATQARRAPAPFTFSATAHPGARTPRRVERLRRSGSR